MNTNEKRQDAVAVEAVVREFENDVAALAKPSLADMAANATAKDNAAMRETIDQAKARAAVSNNMLIALRVEAFAHVERMRIIAGHPAFGPADVEAYDAANLAAHNLAKRSGV